MRSAILTLDIAAVLLFVVVGRDTHEESQGLVDIATTAAPFLLAVVAGWLLLRAWETPLSTRTAVGMWVTTVVGGLLLRRFVYGEGTALPFVVVTTAFFGLTLIGWRLVARWIATRRSGDPTAAL